jgi:DNA-binding SARP family transcriptional activator
MRAMVAKGTRPLAIRAYRQCQEALANELGLEPMAETTRLFDQINAAAS